jgi:hypothetical protein
MANLQKSWEPRHLALAVVVACRSGRASASSFRDRQTAFVPVPDLCHPASTGRSRVRTRCPLETGAPTQTHVFKLSSCPAKKNQSPSRSAYLLFHFDSFFLSARIFFYPFPTTSVRDAWRHLCVLQSSPYHMKRNLPYFTYVIVHLYSTL